MQALRWATAAGLGCGATLLAGGLAEAQAFIVRRHRIPVLAPGSKPIKVLHISDLHLLPARRDELRFLASLGRLEPDLVVSTGDHLSSADAIDPMISALGSLLAVPGVFVFGSNDFVEPSFRNPLGYIRRHFNGAHQHEGLDPAARRLPNRQLQQRLSAQGWNYLDNADLVLTVAGRRIQLRGAGDAHIGLDHYQDVAGPLDVGAELSIAVTHAPYRRVIDAMVDDGFPLVLAGHTHGGQVCFPNGSPIVTNCDADRKHAKGLSRWEHNGASSWLHVSAGMGSSPFAPYRLFCRPEATLLSLVSTDTR